MRRLRLIVLTLATISPAAHTHAGSAGSKQVPAPNFDVYAVGIGWRLQNLTANPALDTSPAVSPDGRRIAFVSDRDGQPDVYVMDSDGRNVTRVTTSPLNPKGTPYEDSDVVWNDGRTQVSWSPDGRSLAFDAVDTSFPPGSCSSKCTVWIIFVVAVDGSSLRQIAVNARAPAWSPRGQTIAFSSDVQQTGEALGVTVARLDGSMVFRVRALNDTPDLGPRWSPRGRRLAFQARDSRTAYRVDVIGANGSDRRRVTSGRTPAWSPDGRKLAFARNGRLYTVNTTGGLHTRRIADWRNVTQPAWSPDGRWIAYVRIPQPRQGRSLQTSRPPRSPSCAIVTPDGSRGRTLTGFREGTRWDAGPVWTGDSRRLVFGAATP